MKQKEIITEVEKERQAKKAILIVIFIIASIAVSSYMFCSCSAPQYGYQTTPPNPKLLVPDVSVRTITGVTKNGKAYTCVDGKGRKAQNIKSDTIDLRMIGLWSDVRCEFDR